MVKKKKAPGAAPTRNDEIRLRKVRPEIFKELQAIAPLVKEVTAPGIVTKLITSYRSDQDLIKQLQSRNTQLHAAIASYVNREADMKHLVETFIKQTGNFNRLVTVEAAKILKQFTRKKAAPKKKGGKK